jgi:hypothetical protein
MSPFSLQLPFSKHQTPQNWADLRLRALAFASAFPALALAHSDVPTVEVLTLDIVS